MNQIISSQDYLLKFFVIVMLLLIFWIFEGIWRKDKRWAIPILLCPPILLIGIIFAWEQVRGRCFFAALFAVMIVLISAVTHYNYGVDLSLLLLDLTLWPYHLLQQIF